MTGRLVGELIYHVALAAIKLANPFRRRRPVVTREYRYIDDVGDSGLAVDCEECKRVTPHNTYFWRIEDEYTQECAECGGVSVLIK